MEHFSFKSGRDVWVARLIKEDWPIVLYTHIALLLLLTIIITIIINKNVQYRLMKKDMINRLIAHPYYSDKQ